MEKVKVVITARPDVVSDDGEIVSDRRYSLADVEGFLSSSDWSDDPKDGKAVLLPDGREMLNPLPIAPPIGFRKEPDILEQVAAQVRKHYEMLRGDLEVDTIEDANDFGEDEDFEPSSVYEIVMQEEFPAVPAVVPDVAVPEPVVPAASVQPVPGAPTV